MIVDRQGRRFRNLRISLTSACNYACTYCVPNGKRLVAAQDELSAEAMVRGVAYLIDAAGIELGNLVVLGNDFFRDDEFGPRLYVTVLGVNRDAKFSRWTNRLFGGRQPQHWRLDSQ